MRKNIVLVLLFSTLSGTNLFAATITSNATGNWSATAWPNTLRTGTITTSNASLIVTGVGTSFTTEISVGNIIKTTTNVVIGTVASITSNISLTLVANAASNNSAINFNVQGVGPGDNVIIASGFTVTLNVNASCVNLTIGTGATAAILTHAATAASINVTGTVTMFQPTGSATNSWLINNGSATVAGLITFAGTNTTTTRIATIVITAAPGTLNANGGITFVGSASATKVINMSGGAGTLNLKGALTVPANSSTLTAGTTSTFNYADNVAQTVNFFSAGAYANLTLNNTEATTGATLGAALTATKVTQNISLNSGLFRTNNLAIAMAGSKTLTVALGATMNAGTSIISPGTTAFVAINGTFQTANTVGFSGSATAAINSTNTPTITLGANSTIEYNNLVAVQVVTARTDYANINLTGLSKTIGTAAAQTLTLSKKLTINTGATYNGATRNPILNIGGDLSNSGTFTQGTALVTFNGTSTQNILGSSATTFSNNVTLNNNTGLSITTSPTINGTLTFTNGNIVTGTNKVILGTTATTAGMAANRCIVGNEEIFIPNAVAPSKTFIVGDASNYTPLLIVFTGTTTGSGSLIVSTTPGDDIDIINSGINPTLSVNRTWTVTQGNVPIGGFTSYNGTFTFIGGSPVDLDVGANTASFVIRKYLGAWATTTVGTRTASTTQATGMTTFGKFQIGEPGTITVATNPVNASGCAGTSKTFTSTSTSVPAPSILWQRDPNTTVFMDITGILDGNVYTNFTTSTLNISDIIGLNNYKYHAVFSNINGSVTSTTASLTALSSPIITTQPSNQSICTAINANFTVATSASSPTYQWQMSSDNASWVNVANGTPAGVAYTNATTSTLTANGTLASALYYYRCIVSAGSCISNSNSATLAISGTIPAVSGTITGSASVCQSQSSVAYSVAAIAGATSYTWNYSGSGFSLASGTGTNSITSNFSAIATSGNLTVQGVNGCGTGTSSANFAVSINSGVPSAAGTISGISSVCKGEIYAYSVASIAGATSYIWTYSGSGLSFSGSNSSTNGSFSTSSTAGNITVRGSNTCGTGVVSPNYAITVNVCAPHTNCNSCHITHSSSGGAITAVGGNANLCTSCHNAVGVANTKPFDNTMKAIPGLSGNSHSWDKPSVNATYQTNKTTNPEMLLRLPGDSINCSTCHNQHTTAAASPFLRISNVGNAMCKDCHSARNISRYSDNIANKGSHPVGVLYPAADSRFKATPDLPIISVSSKVECSSCHQQHYAPTSNGYILRTVTNDNVVCTSCHIDQNARVNLIHKGQTCITCHYAHNTGSNNILLVRDAISTPNSGIKPVVFTSNATAANYADATGTFDGICEVCHTLTDHYTNTSGGTADARHLPAPQKCVTCHPHNNAFYAQANCFDCHNVVQDKPLVGPAGGRRQIVDNTGNGLGTGGDYKRTSHHVTGSIPNVSDCVLCHYMGDHKKGQVKLLDPDQGYLSVYTYDPLNPTSIENFCLNCHDANGAGGDITPFSDNQSVPLFNAALWNASAHKSKPYTCIDCHDNGHGSNKSNMLAPFGYAGAGTGTDVTNEEEGFCLTCHGGTGVATVKVHLAFSSYTNTATNIFEHNPNGTYRKHNKNESTGAAFTGTNRHIECVDCHNPHGAIAGTASAPALLPTMTGAKGVEPIYGVNNTSPGAPTGFTWQGAVTQEYQVCYKCHSSYTTLPTYIPGGILNQTPTANGLKKLAAGTGQIVDSRDMASEYNPNNLSYHPVMAAGKNTGILAAAFQTGFSSTSRIYCSSCHNNNTSATAGYGRGPHGSANLHILDKGNAGTAQYNTMHGTSGDNVNSICSKCHATTYWTGSGSPSRFTVHLYHTGPTGSQKAECYACHDSHGSEQYHLINFSRNEPSCITAVTPNSQAAYNHAAGTATNSCVLTCHGTGHNTTNLNYNPTY